MNQISLLHPLRAVNGFAGHWLRLSTCCLILLIVLLPKQVFAAPPPGPVDAWTRMTLPGFAEGDYFQSILVDPVNPGTLITACGNNDGRKIKWYRSTDYGDTWTLINNTAMNGNPWGFSMDPNPSRNPSTPPTLYSPAGYGSGGIWKSTDGGSNWHQLAGADTAYAPYNPYGGTDAYHTAILPDDPPNHLLVTYHYGFKNNPNNEGGFGESWDGGLNWVIHQPPDGVGSSHYVIPVSATTWCVISQETDRGIWRTTTAGRVGGTQANKFRDGTISTSAWTKVSESHAHLHGSYTPLKIGNAWYSPGYSNSEGGIWKSTDDGATWSALVPGYYWAFPPNAPFLNKNATGLAATDQYIYSNFFVGPELARAPRNADTQWIRNYTATPAALQGFGANPMGNASAKHLPSGNWLVFMATNNGVWRYVEPLSGNPTVSVGVSPSTATMTTGSTRQFTVAISGSTDTGVTWSVQEGSSGGVINASGLYTAAATAGTYHVVATSTADATRSAAATVIVQLPAQIPAGFDVADYLARYPDLQARFGSDLNGAWLYYRDQGVYLGEVFDDTFRVEEYLALYPDLAAIFGNDLSAATVHWLTTGRIEGRLGRVPLVFSATGYFARNADVATAVNSDPILAWQHYWLYGIYEGRAYDDEFRVFEYLAINADLQAAFLSNNWRGAALHWMRYGRTEGRLGRVPTIFNSTDYLARYPEVAATWGTYPTTVWLHYWAYGIDEGRNFDENFRVDEYLAMYPDLVAVFGSDRRGAFAHWVRYGRAEGRLGRLSPITP